MKDSPFNEDASPEPSEVARYVAALSRDLATLAKRARMPVLAYFLEMAREEAEMNVDGPSRRPNGPHH